MVNKSNNDDIKLFFGSLAIGGIVSVIVFVIYWEANKDIASEVLSPFFGFTAFITYIYRSLFVEK